MENMSSLLNSQPAAKRLKTNAEDFKVSANTCITLHLVDPHKARSLPLIECVTHSFKPDFTHQFFGDDEEILGYKGLSINLYFSQIDFQAFVDIKFSHKIHGATDVLRVLQDNFPAGLSYSQEQYISMLSAHQSERQQDLGSQLSFASRDGGAQIMHSNLCGGSGELKALHERMQPLLLFFIDAASFIDAEDERWELLLASTSHNGITEVLGYCTLYTFYAYPDKKRYRLSQILILPPYQRKGTAANLLKAVYHLAEQNNAVDVTFEDPTEALQSLREHVDLQRAFACSELPSVAKAVADCWAACNSNTDTAAVARLQAQAVQLSKQAITTAQAGLRVTQQQARRLWEAILYAQPAVRTDQGLATLAQQVRSRIEGNNATVKKQAEGKRIYNTSEMSFVMRKCSSTAPLGPDSGMPVAMEGEEQSPEEAEQALATAITDRIAAIDAQLGKLGMLQVH